MTHQHTEALLIMIKLIVIKFVMYKDKVSFNLTQIYFRLNTSCEFMISSSRMRMLFRSLLKSTVFFTWYLVLPMSGLRRSAMALEVLYANLASVVHDGT